MAFALTNRVEMAAHVFREYDIRGKAGEEIHESFAYLLGRAFGEKIRLCGYQDVVVARDNRKSSPELHNALICGLQHSSCHVVDAGELTTPMFYYALEHLGIPNGVMITASHNPGDENGFKIAMNKSTIYGDSIQELKTVMQRIQASEGVPKRFNRAATETADIVTPYVNMLKNKIQLGTRKLKVVADCGNGTASPFVPRVLKEWGCEVVPLYCESDPDFPNHHPDPVDPDNLRDLIAKVKSERADLGIAFDGDGDRLGVVDEQGNILWGDRLMILYWREIMPKFPGCEALVEVKCSQALVEEIERLGGKPVFHRTGHSHIKATMKKMQSPFTGEMSGHLFFRDEYFGFDDALYAAGRLLRLLSHTDKKLSELFDGVPQYPATPETRVPCEEAEKQNIVERVKQYFRGTYQVIDVDGARVVFPDGWGLVRCSNTQPILVLRAEAKSEQGLQTVKREIEAALRFAGMNASDIWPSPETGCEKAG